MSIGVLLVTHPGIGQVLLDTASSLLGACPLQAACVEIPLDGDRAELLHRINAAIERLDQGQGVLILTDAFGATPSNMACNAAKRQQAIIVSGINLPMLIRVFNYPELNLTTLANKAAEGAMRGVQISSLGDA